MQHYLCFVLIGTIWILAGCDSQNSTELTGISTGKVEAGTVHVVVDFNGRSETVEFDVPCSDDSTVFSILERGRNMGDIKFESNGSGETAFVTAIDGVENEKSAGDNWTYRVNGKLGDRSSGVFPVKPGDNLLWFFGKYDG